MDEITNIQNWACKSIIGPFLLFAHYSLSENIHLLQTVWPSIREHRRYTNNINPLHVLSSSGRQIKRSFRRSFLTSAQLPAPALSRRARALKEHCQLTPDMKRSWLTTKVQKWTWRRYWALFAELQLESRHSCVTFQLQLCSFSAAVLL